MPDLGTSSPSFPPGWKNVSGPRKLRKSMMFWDLLVRSGMALIEFQDRCLKPLGHPSKMFIRQSFAADVRQATAP